MDERAVALAESTLRRSLASLDGVAVPTLSALRARRRRLSRWRALFAPLVTAAVVLVAALALGDALATWRTDRASTGASAGSPTATARAVAPSPSPSASETVTLPTDCPAGTLPELKIDFYPQGNEHGGATPAVAFTAAYPSAGAFTTYRFGSLPGAPTWIVAGSRTFIATVLPDGSWFVSPATFVRCMPPPAQRYLDVDGYRFTVSVVSDARYGVPPAAAYVSAVSGVGIRCEWGRTGADLARAADLFGAINSVAQTGAVFSPVTRDTHSDRANGIPAAAVHGQTASLICGVEDDTGRHGVVIDLAIAPDGAYTVRSLTLSRWSGGTP